MKILNKNIHKKRTVIILLACFVASMGVLGAYYVYSAQQKPVAEQIQQGTMLFSFDAAAAPGWHRSALDASVKESRQSILLFDRDITQPSASAPEQLCHVSAFLNEGSVDVTAKQQEFATSNHDLTVTTLETKQLRLRTDKNQLPYDLVLYEARPPSVAEPIKSGYAIGYTQAGSHYIELQAVCDTPDRLEAAIAAFEAISFNSTAPRD